MARVWLLVAGLVLSIGALACSSEGREPAPRPTRVQQTATGGAPSLRIIPLGEEAISEQGRITIQHVRGSRAEGEHEAPEGSEWRIFDISVVNTGSEPFTLEAEMIHADGRSFERVIIPSLGNALDAPLGPGAGATGYIAFEVEAQTVSGILIYGPGEALWALELGTLPPLTSPIEIEVGR